jgi:predicted phage terminase large subunit-like protein
VNNSESWYKFQSWDTASKLTEMADYSVCTTWGVGANGDLWLLDVFRRRLDYPELKRKVRELAQLHGVRMVLIEDCASGIQLLQELRHEGFARIVAVKPSGSKEMRMVAQTGRIEAGKVWIPESAHWRDSFLSEFAVFPNGRYDDQVDSTSQALAWAHCSSGPQRWLATMDEVDRRRSGAA